jgi:hypothetical protein
MRCSEPPASFTGAGSNYAVVPSAAIALLELEIGSNMSLEAR